MTDDGKLFMNAHRENQKEVFATSHKVPGSYVRARWLENTRIDLSERINEKLLSLLAMGGHKPSQEVVWQMNNQSKKSYYVMLLDQYLTNLVYNPKPDKIKEQKQKTLVGKQYKDLGCNSIKDEVFKDAMYDGYNKSAQLENARTWMTLLLICSNKKTMQDGVVGLHNLLSDKMNAHGTDFAEDLMTTRNHPFYPKLSEMQKSVEAGNFYATYLSDYFSSHHAFPDDFPDENGRFVLIGDLLASVHEAVMPKWREIESKMSKSWNPDLPASAPSDLEIEAISVLFKKSERFLENKKQSGDFQKDYPLTPVILGTLAEMFIHLEKHTAQYTSRQQSLIVDAISGYLSKAFESITWRPDKWSSIQKIHEEIEGADIQSKILLYTMEEYQDKSNLAVGSFSKSFVSIVESAVPEAEAMVHYLAVNNETGKHLIDQEWRKRVHVSFANQKADKGVSDLVASKPASAKGMRI